MGGQSARAKSLAAAYWRMHKRPAGKDNYGALDPAFAKQQAKQAEDQGGRGMDPWARSTADMYEEELRKARGDIQRLEKAVADLRSELAVNGHEEAGLWMGSQPGGRARGCSDGQTGTQRGGAERHQPVHARNGGGDPARVEEQYHDELSTMS